MNALLSKFNTSKSSSLLTCALIVAALQGCGGGGGGGGGDSASGGTNNSPSSSPSPTPTAPAAPTASIAFDHIKQLRVSWSAPAGATYYKLLESTNDGTTYTQVGGNLTALTYSRDIAIHLQNWAATRYQVQACNGAGCTASNTLTAGSAVFGAIGYFKASNTDSGDTYGWTLALSGDGRTLAVGAPGEDSGAKDIGGNPADNSKADSGAVYVFTLNGSNWEQQAYIKASNTLAAARFGSAVTLSHNGNTLAVGAPFDDSAATTIGGNQNDHSASGAGAAYVFERSGSSWNQQAYIKASNTAADLYFGWSLALSDDGNLLAAGAPGAATNVGAAYVFGRSGSSWSERAQVTASNAGTDDNFGAAIALSGNGTTLAVGSPYEASAGSNQADNSAAKAGAVYVFTGSGSSWTQQAYVKASNTDIDDNFGAALALSDAGDTLAVGAPYEQSNATGVGGDGSNDSADDAGAAYVFKRTGSSWAQQAYIKASNTNVNDDFGMALALSSDGNALVVGAIGESINSVGVKNEQTDNTKQRDGVGAAYLFNRNGNAWSQQRYIKPSTAQLGAEFGSAIGLSADATTLAISGAFERSNATGIGGDQTSTTSTDSGALWLY